MIFLLVLLVILFLPLCGDCHKFGLLFQQPGVFNPQARDIDFQLRESLPHDCPVIFAGSHHLIDPNMEYSLKYIALGTPSFCSPGSIFHGIEPAGASIRLLLGRDVHHPDVDRNTLGVVGIFQSSSQVVVAQSDCLVH